MRGRIPAWRWIVSILLFLCAAGSLYLSLVRPEMAGGRGGMLVSGLLFFGFGAALLRPGAR